MDLEIVSVGSSSSGNSYIIRSKETSLIFDVGLSARAIKGALAALGVAESDVAGILVSHEHADHVKSVRAMARACENAGVVTSYGTASACHSFEYVPDERLKIVKAQDELQMGDIAVKAFALSHDASEPLGYSFTCGDTKLAVVTDTGTVTDEIFEEITSADLLVLEANHEVGMLEMGPYPYFLKKRILSDFGHLSNVASGEALARALDVRRSAASVSGEPLQQVMLAHLSTNNNTPANADITVKSILTNSGFCEGADYNMGIARKNEITEIGHAK